MTITHNNQQIFPARFFRHAFVMLLYLGMTLIYTYPLVRHFNTHILGDGFDANQFPIGLWWVRHAVVDLHTNPLASDYLFYPFGVSLVFHSMTFLNGLLSIPLQPLLGLTATVNVFSILTFVLSAYGAFLLVRFLTGNTPAAFISGCIFGFFPYRVISAMGSYHFLNTQWIPFYVLFLMKQTRETTWRNSLLTGLFLLLTAGNSYNNAIFLMLFTGMYLLYLLIASPALLTKSFLARFAVSIGVFFIGFSPVLYQAFQQITTYGDFVGNEAVGTDLLFFFLPSILHPIFGKLVAPLHHGISPSIPFTTVYMGYTVFGIAMYAVIRARRWRDQALSIYFWALIAAIFFLLTLGPSLQILGTREFHIGSWNFFVPLPHALLLKIPIINGSRISGRFSVMLMLSLAVLVGYACAQIFPRVASAWTSWHAYALAGGILFLIHFEYFTFPFPLHAQTIYPFYREIGQEPGDFSLLQVPLQLKSGGPTLAVGSSDLDLMQVVHQKRLIGGHVSRAPDAMMNYFSRLPVISRLLAIQHGRPVSAEARREDQRMVEEVIRFLNLKYILVHSDTHGTIGFFMYPESPERLEQMVAYIEAVFPIERVERDKHVTRYTLTRFDQPAGPHIDFGDPLANLYLKEGWITMPNQPANSPSVRMDKPRATLMLRLLAKTDQTCALRLAPFYQLSTHGQTLDIALNGHPVQSIDIPASERTYRITLPVSSQLSGINLLEFRYHYDARLSHVLNFTDGFPAYIAFEALTCSLK